MRWLALGAAAVVAVVMAVLFAGLVAVGGIIGALPAAQAATCSTPGNTPTGEPAPVGELDAEQSHNASEIIAAGQAAGIPQRGWVIAVATARQESSLHNVNHGDAAGPDSTGLFQQRDSWGPREVRMDPRQSAGLFYARLVDVPNWDTRPLYESAQTVQRSAYPMRYQQWEPLAESVVASLAGVAVAGPSCQAAAVAGGWALPLPPQHVHSPMAEHWRAAAVDLPLPPGSTEPVFAITAGTASPMEEPSGCGHGVYVRSGTDAWLYCHLSAQEVTAGQQVTAGERLGVSGWSGHVEPFGPGGAHLHVQLERNGALVCINTVIDVIAAGQPPPTDLPAKYPCLG